MPELITGQKTPEQIQAMREGGKLIAQIFDDIRAFVREGISSETSVTMEAFTGNN